jgi:hypothetical protein
MQNVPLQIVADGGTIRNPRATSRRDANRATRARTLPEAPRTARGGPRQRACETARGHSERWQGGKMPG